MSELAPIHPATVVPTVKKIGERQNQNKREKQAEDDSQHTAQTQSDDQPAQHVDEIV